MESAYEYRSGSDGHVPLPQGRGWHFTNLLSVFSGSLSFIGEKEEELVL